MLGEAYMEPFAGGAGLALKLLLNDDVKRIIINDYDTAIYSFWHSILYETDAFCELINTTPVTTEEWKKQEAIRAKQRAANLQKYTQMYGEKIAKAIVDGRVIPGMTINMITDEMGLSYQMLNSSTIIVGPAIGGVMVFEMYKCAVTNGKITMVENIFMKGNY